MDIESWMAFAAEHRWKQWGALQKTELEMTVL
jgi:hypothetical protein